MTRNTTTFIRTATLILALVNQVLLIFDMPIIEVEDAVIESLINSFATVIASVWAWWGNNSFSNNAKEADRYLDALSGKTTEALANEKNADSVSHEL